jgi:protein required for attachment to host cells
MHLVKKILVVTADSGHAQFYLAYGPKKLTHLEHYEHPEAHLHEQDFTTKEHDINTCPYEGKIKKEHDNLIFAKLLLKKMQEYLQTQDHIEEVCVLAPPKFLGILRNDKMAQTINFRGIAKDLMHRDNNENLQAIGQAVYSDGMLAE